MFRSATESQPDVSSAATGWLHILAALSIFVAALVVLSFEAGRAAFEGDEADYVSTSRYFGYLFLQRDVGREEWGDNHWTRTQPPLTRYIIGAWLWARGHDLESLNQPYVSTASSVEVNRRKGRVPDDRVLADARQPMVLLGAAAIALLYPLAAALGGPLAGLTTAGLALSSSFIRYTVVHAWAEAPLAFFLVLSAVVATYGASRAVARREWKGWAIALGVALGLASATKLTGAVGAFATVAWGLTRAAVVGRRAGAVREPPLRCARSLIDWTVASVSIALLVFLAVNPYLWRGPIKGVLGMVEERGEEMAAQQRQWPEYAVLDARERPFLTLAGSLRVGPRADSSAAVLINLLLVVVGAAKLVALARAGGVPPGGWPALGMLLSWLGAYLLAISSGLGLSYPRYFLPSCLLLLPFAGLGLATLLGLGKLKRASEIVWPTAGSRGGSRTAPTPS